MSNNKGSLNRSSLFIKFVFGLIIGVVFFIIYDLNRIYPFFTDDWDYHFLYYGDHKIQSVFEVFPSMVKHYTMWGGQVGRTWNFTGTSLFWYMVVRLS